jgi:PKD repeat protein
VGAGDIARCDKATDEATAALMDTIAGTVFTAGDNIYVDGSSADFTNCYNPSWGRHKARTYPSAGDKEYLTAGAAGYFSYFGAAAGDTGKGYYSYNLGSWHVVVLNSNVAMTAGSAQELWLKSDLAASTAQCTVAYWHHPRFYSGSGNPRASVLPLWNDLYGAGADLVLNGHTRNYERFAPQAPDGTADPSYGIREIIVGTGGIDRVTPGTVAANSEVRGTSYGVLKVTLDSARYAWKLISIAGQTLVDSGSTACHGAPAPVARPGGPYASENAITFDGSASFDPQGDTPLTYGWDFGDGTTGTGVAPVHQYASYGVYTVTLVVTDSKGNPSAPATTTATAQNFPPALDAGPDIRTHPSETVQLAMLFSDPGVDAPWSYTIAWGDGTTSNGSTSNKAVPLVVAHSYFATGLDSVRVTLTDAGGASTSDSVAVYIEAPGTPQVFIGAGDIATCANTNDEATAKLLDAVPGTVFTLGDNAYPMGALADYTNCYNPTWGRHRDRTHASLGNHEYAMKGAVGTYDYFGVRVGPRGLGYYSYDLGDWHIVVLNDNLSGSAGTTQLSWLTSDLAASTKQCALAISHQPLFFSPNSGTAPAPTANRQFWTRLYAAGAELFLNGHQHLYERFAPQTPDSVADPALGIREFVVGTGGESSWTFGTTPAANSEVRASTFGVLKLTLGPGSYSWQFIPIAGQTFADSGSGTCH